MSVVLDPLINIHVYCFIRVPMGSQVVPLERDHIKPSYHYCCALPVILKRPHQAKQDVADLISRFSLVTENHGPP